jgi:hypothetical protein
MSIVVAVLGLVLLMGAGVAAESGQPTVPGAGPLVGEPIHGPLQAAKSPAAAHVPPGLNKTPKK